MSLHPYTGRPFGLWNDFADESLLPYWARRAGLFNNFNNIVPTHQEEVENTDQKFAVKLDVAAFKPEELKVNLEGHVLTVEGHHELKTEHGVTKRSFTRQFTLPKNVDLAHIHTAINKDGQMTIDVPKTGAISNVRAIPIHTSAGRAVTQKSSTTSTGHH
uniref:SHSP domain-containing protein n=1 Tax=Caenorhabditis japonica TaxID=281687 RepID=A0A8R1DX37_CAEJA